MLMLFDGSMIVIVDMCKVKFDGVMFDDVVYVFVLD